MEFHKLTDYRKLQIARLQDEVRQLKEGGGATADNIVLQHQLDDAKRARERLEHDFLEASTEKLLLESRLNSMRSASGSPGY